MVSCFDSAEQHTKLKELEPALLCLTEAEQLLDKLDIHSSLNFAMAYQSAARLVEEINSGREQKRAKSLPRGPRLDGWEQPSRQREF